MSFADVLALASAAPPGLQTSITTVSTIYNRVQDVKVCKQQCSNLVARCGELLSVVHESSADTEGTTAIEFADEVEAILQRILRRITEWASYNLVRSLLNSNNINDEIAVCNRQIDVCLAKFNVKVNAELIKHQRSERFAARDRIEVRELLQKITSSNDELGAIGRLHFPAKVEMMQNIAEELDDPSLEASENQDLRRGLKQMQEYAGELSPVSDLTGQVELDEYPISFGGFADTFIGKWAGEKVALRLVRRLQNGPDYQKRFVQEVEILRRLQHPNVCRLYGTAYFGNSVYLVSHWMDRGNAVGYVQNHTYADRLRLLSEVASGMEYLHTSNVVHGDLRGVNVLISTRGKACLTDFGFAKVLEEFDRELDSTTHLTNVRWSAPELIDPRLIGLSQESHSMSTDVWSFGMLCLELMTGLPPYSNIPEDITVMFNITKSQLPSRPGHPTTSHGLTDELWTLMTLCWDTNPQSRPSMSAIKKGIRELKWDLGSFPDTSSAVPAGSPTRLGIKLNPEPLSKLIQTSEPKTRRSFGLFNTLNRQSWSSPQSTLNNSSPLLTIASSGTPMSSSTFVDWTMPNLRVVRTKDGSIEAGTFEGLIEHLITEFYVRAALDYKDTFFTTYIAFATSDDVFQYLVRRFHDAETSPAQHRVHLHMNIIAVMKYWVTNPCFKVSDTVLSQMGDFAMSIQSSESMKTLAERLFLDTTERLQLPSSSPVLSLPSTPSAMSRPTNARELAIALSKLEGDKYARILPTDYISYFQHGSGNAVKAAFEMNNKVASWVKQSILRYDDLGKRSEILKFFIYTAEECRKFQNFTSMSAITAAVQSAPLTHLRNTYDRLPRDARRMLEAMQDLTDQRQFQSAYRAALKDSDHRPCIPLLAVHIGDMRTAFSEMPDIVDIDGISMINFAKWTRFHACIKDIFRHQPPDVSEYRDAKVGMLAYMEQQLRGISTGPTMDKALQERASKLREKEDTMGQLRLRELKLVFGRTRAQKGQFSDAPPGVIPKPIVSVVEGSSSSAFAPEDMISKNMSLVISPSGNKSIDSLPYESTHNIDGKGQNYEIKESLVRISTDDAHLFIPDEPPEPSSFSIDLIPLEDLQEPIPAHSPVSISVDLYPLEDLVDPIPDHDIGQQSLYFDLYPLGDLLPPIPDAIPPSSSFELHDS